MSALGPLLQAHTTILPSQTLAIPPGTSFAGSVKYLSILVSAMFGTGRDPIFPSDTDSCPSNLSLPPPDVSLEYELVTFMAVFLGGLHGVYIRHFPDPLFSQGMHVEARGCTGMGAYLLPVHRVHVWEGFLTSQALCTTLFVIAHCARLVLTMRTVVSQPGKMLLAPCTALPQLCFDSAEEI